MNCRRAEKLIPLYVEGDLASRLADRLTSHIEWCSRCNWLADDYKESQRWLRSAGAPVFDEPLFADLKRDVLQEISNINARQSLISTLAQRWNRWQVLASCASLMIIFGVLALYLYQSRTQGSRERNEEVKQAQNRDDDQLPSKSTAVTGPAPAASPAERHQGTKHPRSLKRDNHNVPALALHETTDNRAERVRSTPDFSIDSRDMLRIEIQTSDPNIRIIWFAPKETESHQNKPATD